MRALVTGGSGFIGSHVADKLVEKGVLVRILDTVPPHRTDVERYDVSILDYDRLRSAMNGVDVVFHLGAVADVQDAAENPQYTDMINTRGTINVLEAARRAGVRRVI